MYAIIETGGKQYKVREGYTLKVEKLNVEVGSEVNFDNVLLLSDDDSYDIGSPFVEGAVVKATVKGQGKNKRVSAFKYKAKKTYSRNRGHRQPYTEVKIDSIVKND